MNNQLAIGIDIGGTNTKVGFFSRQGELLGSLHFPTQKSSASAFFKFIHQSCVNDLKDKRREDYKIMGIGIGAPMANAQTGMISYAHNLDWRDVAIRDEFQALFNCPVFIDNDANLAALGESYFGVGKNSHSFILLTLGTGVGTGFILNRKIVRGWNGLGGEGGHIIIDTPQSRTCPCGGHNHIEAYLGAAGIAQTLKENDLDIELKEISHYLDNNDPRAHRSLELICDQLSSAIVNMCVLIGPEKVILAGGVSQMGEVFLRMVEAKVNEKIFYSLKHQMSFHLAEVSTKEGAIFGGAALVFTELS